MATGHILPGYGNPVSRLRRARSAGSGPLDKTTLFELQNAARLSQKEYEDIRRNARGIWATNNLRPTTYDTFFGDGEIRDIQQTRPTSSHRHNNPHPPQVFLTNRLHYIEGYQNPDTTLGKSSYKIDASLSPAAQAERRAPRVKYVARPDAALVNQYKDPYGFKNMLPPREAQAAEAWVKLADDEDKGKVMGVIHEHAEAEKLQGEDDELRPKSAYPSLHRWMKMTGAQEHCATSRIMQTLASDPLRQYGYAPQRLGQKKREDIIAAGSYRFRPQLRRGEFSMHPDWPSSIPHHRVP